MLLLKLASISFMSALGAISSLYGQGISASSLYKANAQFGLRLTVEEKRDGTTRMVSPHSDFRTGDQVRLHLVSNVDGYVYAVNQTPTGETRMIFPTAETGSDNTIRKGVDYSLPGPGGWFRMTGRSGIEQVFVVVSPNPIPDMEVRFREGGAIGAGQPASPAPLSPQTAAVPSAATPLATAPHNEASLAMTASGGASNSTAPVSAVPAGNPVTSGGGAVSTGKSATQTGRQNGSPMNTVTQDINAVHSGVSLINNVAQIPRTISSIPGLGSKDLVFEDDVKEASTYVSALPGGLVGPAVFSIALVHK